MNGYDLSRSFWNFCFENPEKIKPNHIAMYFFAIEHCNRLGWKEKFGFPTTMVMEAIGIKSYNTFINTLKELVEYGFIEMIEKSKNQYSANIIALSKFNKALNKANDKALDKALTKHSVCSIKKSESTVQSTVQSIDSINKQTNKQTNTNNSFNKNEKTNSSFSQIPDPSSTSPKIDLSEKEKSSAKKEKELQPFKDVLLEYGAEEEDVNEWFKLRIENRKKTTRYFVEQFILECKKNNFSVKESVYACAFNGWVNFNAQWLINQKKSNNGAAFNNNGALQGSKISGRANPITVEDVQRIAANPFKFS